ncbi:MAG: CDP-alcohol phosphatidyltransferase family protein [Thermoanaerobaculia bacterium]|nr:CDP-alcohol phosphatidyltransferase family protein [Thermoanaerobaculia bacterium]
MTEERLLRRPIAARGTRWAAAIAAALARWGVAPNAISAASILFAAGTATALVAARGEAGGARAAWLVVAALAIPLRLLANLFDGMVAVEGGRKSASGEIWNELPDRISDTLCLVAAGWAVPAVAWAPLAGWSAALAAVLTAYVRTLGVAAGAAAQFIGPAAKQQRMVLLALALVAAAGEAITGAADRALPWTLLAIGALSLLTAARRVRRIVGELEGWR